METVGEILRQERLKQGKTLLKIHRDTKIPEKTLMALEENNFSALPPSTFVVGFIKIYSQTLGLSSQRLIAIYRRDWLKDEPKDIIPPGLKNPIDNRGFSWTPKTTLIFTISLIAVLILAFIGLELYQYFSPPVLVVISPTENQKIIGNTVAVSGSTDKDTGVYVNDQLVNINEEGKFSYNLKIFPGFNTILIKAVDRKSKTTIINRHITAE